MTQKHKSKAVLIVLLMITFAGLVVVLLYGLPVLWMLVVAYIQPITPTDRKDTIQLGIQAVGVIVQFLGGLLLLLNLYYTSRTFRLSQEGQITDRFTEAINQMGAMSPNGPQLETRLGAIYALNRIARDSDRDYWTIIEILMAYLRENAYWNSQGEDKDTQLAESRKEVPKVRADIQAILTILEQRSASDRKKELGPLIFGMVDLRFINIQGIHLEGADFRKSRLVRGALRNSHLGPMSIEASRPDGDTRFEEAWLHELHLEQSDLTRAHFDDAILFGAHLNNAILKDADFRRADLRRADLRGATLTNAILDEADLRMADLREVKGLTQKQVDQAYTDEQTQLPTDIKSSKRKK